ncbi:MAG: SDR family NAD(P)-dependent oxidoreductase [Micrococcales bacterium]
MGRHAIITGGSAGIGLQVALGLAGLGFDLTLISSNSDRLERARDHIRLRSRRQVAIARVDLSDLDEVAAFAKTRDKPWNLLVNNAGIKIVENALPSAQGFERHLAVNHLAHFALTAGLMPTALPEARIVSVSSIVARFAPSEVFASSGLSTSQRYAASKLANLGFSIELENLLRSAGKTQVSVAAHPGFTRAEPYGTRVTRLAEYLMAQPASMGAKPILDAALSESPSAYTGPRFAELWGKPTQAWVNPIATDREWLGQLWNETERLTGTKFQV